jgi:hypothetical protein
VGCDGEPGKLTAGGGEASRPSATPVTPRSLYYRSAIDEILPHVGRGVAAGRLHDVDGRPLTPIVGPGDTGAAEGLTEPSRSMRFVHHVESNATAYMRQHGIRQAVLYTNMRPCLGDDGCTDNLRATLPAGYTLYVYQVRSGGDVRVWEFPGTGEGLADE